ncbi:uncharacterized protein SYNPCC7002_A1628 [Nilaparvata lugens]|uniref:uncharacterized protein SYNPCC7002_A1628 n=1 Tax=Nilaparvata lugens TaxID=108931 RepID=UPI00193D56CD|nr:uncharacterized protein SYNPCC7002_A1628 [Nilaparvata lugens]
MCLYVLYVGGTVLASLVSLQRGMACSTAGGTHHAFPDRGAGFCLLNDLAVAAKYLLDHRLAANILIVDLDVHQGDGTANIFKNNKNVFTFSIHSRKNFPFRKEQSDLDIALEDGVEDDEFLNILQDNLNHILCTFRPDFVLYDAGVDPHKNDLLGKLNISDSGLMKRDLFVLSEIAKKGIPIASVIGGGYSDSIDELAKRHTILHRAATKVWMQFNRLCL